MNRFALEARAMALVSAGVHLLPRRAALAFGRALGREFTVIVAPPHPTGDEIMPEGWATGTGGTLAPLTTNCAHQLAESLVDAFLAQTEAAMAASSAPAVRAHAA